MEKKLNASILLCSAGKIVVVGMTLVFHFWNWDKRSKYLNFSQNKSSDPKYFTSLFHDDKPLLGSSLCALLCEYDLLWVRFNPF